MKKIPFLAALAALVASPVAVMDALCESAKPVYGPGRAYSHH